MPLFSADDEFGDTVARHDAETFANQQDMTLKHLPVRDCKQIFMLSCYRALCRSTTAETRLKGLAMLSIHEISKKFDYTGFSYLKARKHSL